MFPFSFLILIAAVILPNVEDYLTDGVARKLHGTGVAEVRANDTEKLERRRTLAEADYRWG